jgi:hypothetical protein
MCVQRLAEFAISVRSRLMCCHGIWFGVYGDACGCWIMSESWAHHASDGSCHQTLWERG